jgi:two-component system, response regulator YesN
MSFSAPPTSGPSARAPRILLVDDDPVILRAVRRLLLGARPNWAVDVADSAKAAFLLLESRTYDVAMTDLHMPVQDGLQLLSRLETEHPTMMRVLHSSHLEAAAESQVRDLAHAVVVKGRPEELVEVLEWALGERRRRVPDSMGF